MIIPSRRWLIGAAALALLALPALVWPGTVLLYAGANVVWIGLLAWDAIRAGAGALLVERDPPPAFSARRTLAVAYRWTLGARRPQVVRVREWFPPPLGGSDVPERAIRLIPGVNHESLDITPIRRGRGSGGRMAIRRLGPLGLAWKQERRDIPWDATVFPNLTGAGLRALPSRVSRRREAGLRSIRRPGEGRLFESLREWIPGDDTRIIDWKATARRGKPIARVYEDERRQQVLIVLDAGRLLTAESAGVPRIEAAIEAALRLAHAAVEHDDDVGILVFADEIQAFTAPARGRRGLRAVLGALAAVEGRLVESDYPSAFRYLAARSRKRALTVLFTDVIDRSASAALVAQTASLRPRHLPVAVTLRDPALEQMASARPATELVAFERAAAEELMLARSEALDQMRRQGVVVLDVAPGGAGEAVVQGYQHLKRRGLL